jgi:molybdopterin converting factor small subunit
MVRVRLYGSARKPGGQGEVEVQFIAGARLADVLRQVAGPDGPPRASAILVNGRNCAFQEGPATAIADGDLIEVLPIVTGG